MGSLLDLTTNLKSLKFGSAPVTDRPGGGNSGQPYITTPIPGTLDPIPGNFISTEDFLLRGGINGPKDTASDLLRLSKFFNNRNSPAGSLFTVKQNLLSRVSVRNQASGVGLNEGVYTPLSTLAQAGINLEGGHIPKQGVRPFQGPKTYSEAIKEQIIENQGIVSISGIGNLDLRSIVNNEDEFYYLNEFPILERQNQQVPNNRLIQLNQVKRQQSLWSKTYKKNNQVSKFNTEILSYGGGPNSLAGLGETRIKIATDPLGSPITTGKDNFKLYNGNIGFAAGEQIPSVNKPYVIFSNPTIQDFRREKLKDAKGVSTIMGLSPSYDQSLSSPKTIDGPRTSRINYTSPGQRGNIIDYSQGKLDSNGVNIGPVDRINALPIYRSDRPGLRNSIAENDLIKFRIGAISNANPDFRDYVNFRAYIDSFSDSYNASWTPQKYMGRGESFYKYDSFSRDINLSFTLAAQSKEEMMVMYRKLNYLVSNLAPDYTNSGYMAGPLVQLTLGAWCYELPGFIKSITLDVPQEAPWEIGIPNLNRNDKEIGGIKYRDPSVKEMPMICKVTGFSFTPIHKFRPAKQSLSTDKSGKGAMLDSKKGSTVATLQDENIYGPERYLSLANGGDSKNIDYDSYNKK